MCLSLASAKQTEIEKRGVEKYPNNRDSSVFEGILEGENFGMKRGKNIPTPSVASNLTITSLRTAVQFFLQRLMQKECRRSGSTPPILVNFSVGLVTKWKCHG